MDLTRVAAKFAICVTIVTRISTGSDTYTNMVEEICWDNAFAP